MQLPYPFKTPLVNLIGANCYSSLVENLNLLDAKCRNLLISKLLGLGIVVGGSIVKLPQVIKIVRARSALGLSLASSILETSGYVVSLAYNFRAGNPFSTYGETFFIAIQNVVILSLILYHRGNTAASVLLPLLFLGTSRLLAEDSLVSSGTVAVLQLCTIPTVALSRAPQIYQNWKNGSTGQLAAFTVAMFFAGAVARIYTTLQEVDDRLILTGFLLGAFFNGILLFQMVYYWDSGSPVKARKSKSTSISPRKHRSKKVE